MVNKKLAILLASAVMLGQTGLDATRLAQADSKIPFPTESQTESIQVASVIQHTEINPSSDEPTNENNRPVAPDVYTIGGGKGQLPIIIQTLPQDDGKTSLFVNGTEILRFSGIIDGVDSYQRVKSIANKLNRMLVLDGNRLDDLRPAMLKKQGSQNQQAVIRYGNEVLATVDAPTALMVHDKEPELAFLYTNRLRRALGALQLKAQDLTALLATSQKSVSPAYKATGRVQTGMASWYGGFFNGRRAADGSRFNMNAMTAAHRSFPFGTMVKVVNHRTQKSCYVKITDRGPFARGRIIDLSRGAAKSIGMLGSGVARVSVEVVRRG